MGTAPSNDTAPEIRPLRSRALRWYAMRPPPKVAANGPAPTVRCTGAAAWTTRWESAREHATTSPAATAVIHTCVPTFVATTRTVTARDDARHAAVTRAASGPRSW